MTGASEATQDICPDCCGTGGGHPDNLAGKCYRCDGTGGIPKTTEAAERIAHGLDVLACAMVERDRDQHGNAPPAFATWPAQGATLLRKQADEIERLRAALVEAEARAASECERANAYAMEARTDGQ